MLHIKIHSIFSWNEEKTHELKNFFVYPYSFEKISKFKPGDYPTIIEIIDENDVVDLLNIKEIKEFIRNIYKKEDILFQYSCI